MPIDLICLDADHTLWRNMRHFDAAMRSFDGILELFAQGGVARERLATVQARNLALYGYGRRSGLRDLIQSGRI